MGSTAEGSMTSGSYTEGVRMIVLNLPEDEGEGLGFRLTRTLWDPYPWVRDVTPGGRAEAAGVKTGDCVLQTDGKDVLGMPVSQVAGLIRGDGVGRQVNLLVWNCGVDPKNDPDLLWSCGGGVGGERARRTLSRAVRALTCVVCNSTPPTPRVCARSHLYCLSCWTKLERCALCREALPPTDSPYARNLVAEQVFEAIAAEYDLKTPRPKLATDTSSTFSSPIHSPNLSPSPNRRGQYHHSMMNRSKKTVHFNDKFGPTYASDPNIHRSSQSKIIRNPNNLVENSHSQTSNPGCSSYSSKSENSGNLCNVPNVPKINVDPVDSKCSDCSSCQNLSIQHKLVARLRHACSLADLPNVAVQCPLSMSLNNLEEKCKHDHRSSLDDLKKRCGNNCGKQTRYATIRYSQSTVRVKLNGGSQHEATLCAVTNLM